MRWAIYRELEQQGVANDQPQGRRWQTICRVGDDLIDRWFDDSQVPRNQLECLLEEHRRLQGREWDLADEIERIDGAISPMYDFTSRRHPATVSLLMPVGIFELEDHHCRWPIAGEGVDTVFCGDQAALPKPYCPLH